MSSDTWNLFSSGSAARPAHRPQDSSAAQLAGAAQRKRIRKDGKGQDRKGKDAATSLCLFARLPLEFCRRLVGYLSYSDVAAWACSISHKDTKQLLLGYMRRRCCVSTFKRLLVEYGAITTNRSAFTVTYSSRYVVKSYDEHWDVAFFKIPEERKDFWRRAIEIIFMCEPKSLLHGKHYRRYPALVQQDYIHSCGVLFASKAKVAMHRHLERKFRASCKAPIRVQSRFRLLNISPNIT